VDKRQPGILAFAGLGMLNALCLGIGLGVGWLIDRALSTLPLFLFLGLIVGIAMGVLATRAELKRYF
jgi:F0F1-type ATP synthase assembly protein I